MGEIVPRVEELVGAFASVVAYEAYVIGYAPAADVEAIADAAWETDILAVPEAFDRHLFLPYHRLDLSDSKPSRFPEGAPSELTNAVPGLFLVGFAYPVTAATLDGLWSCGAERVLGLASRAWLVRAASAETLTGCEPAAEQIAWVDAWRLADRVDPALFSGAPEGELLVLAEPSASVEEIVASIEGLELLASRDTIHGALASLVATSEGAFAALLAEPRLLTMEVAPPPPAPSGERQNQVIARQGQVIGGVWVPDPGYETFLTNRGLDGNDQVILVVDTGFDDGSAPSPTNHNPALANALVGGINIAFFPNIGFNQMDDPGGHGTTVAGVLSGRGGADITIDKDASGFQYGLGVAPETQIYAAKWYQPGTTTLTTAEFQTNLSIATGNANGSHAARISSNSWNSTGDTTYNPHSRFHDDLVRTHRGIANPLSVVFAAGNDFMPPINLLEAPANGKNVIAVGSTDNFHPFSGTPVCAGFGSASAHNPTNIDQVSYFSRRGQTFAPLPASNRAHNTRIKPDLVAPGWRVHSTAPYSFPAYVAGSTRCAAFDPDLMGTVNDKYTFNLGTSYAAPAVSGVAAHANHHFAQVLGGIHPPSASLIKAGLIATADNLGDPATGCNGDCRPSNTSGWGRVNLDRLSNGTAAYNVNEEWGLATGQSFTSSVLSIANPLEPILIVLAWSDPSDPTSAGALQHDLNLKVWGPSTYQNDFYIGNTFNENFVLGSGIDDGWSHHYSGLGRPAVLQDHVNNVEAVFIPAGTMIATLRIQVTAGTIDPNLDLNGQTFSVYAYNLF